MEFDNLNQIYKALDVLSVRIKATSSDTESSNQQAWFPDRDTSICLYDITTYAFESTDQDALRDFGYSKDKKI